MYNSEVFIWKITKFKGKVTEYETSRPMIFLHASKLLKILEKSSMHVKKMFI